MSTVSINLINPNVQTMADVRRTFQTLSLALAAMQIGITEADITLSDVTTDNVSSTKHGFAPKSPADATKFLNGAATPVYAQVKDSDLATTDVTSNNATTAKHGFVPKGPNSGTNFFRDDATYAAVKDTDLAFTDVTGNNVSTTKHGYAPKAPNDGTQFLDGTGAFDNVLDSDLSTSDITTNNVTTAKHGFTPKAPNDTTKFFRGDATWAVPAYPTVANGWVQNAAQAFAAGAANTWFSSFSISVPAGEWDLTGQLFIQGGNCTGLYICVSQSNANPPADVIYGDNAHQSAVYGGVGGCTVAALRVSLGGTTPYYLMTYLAGYSVAPNLWARMSARRIP